MDCSNCGQPLEAGAAFCGNCGHPILRPATVQNNDPKLPQANNQTSAPLPAQDSAVSTAADSTIGQVYKNEAAQPSQTPSYPDHLAIAGGTGVPNYAVPVVEKQHGDLEAAMSLVIGVMSIVGSLLIPFVGIALAVTAIVLATLARHATKRRLATVGLVVAIIALLVGMAFWVLAVTHDSRLSQKVSNNKPAIISGQAVTGEGLTTPCYSVNFGMLLSIQNNDGSCNMDAFNGTTLDDSTNAYKVYGTFSNVSSSGFMSLAKQAIERDIAQSLPTFTIVHETAGQFAGAPAYFVTADNGQGISVMEAVALHPTSSEDNFFVFVHAVNSGTATLTNLQTGWRWQ